MIEKLWYYWHNREEFNILSNYNYEVSLMLPNVDFIDVVKSWNGDDTDYFTSTVLPVPQMLLTEYLVLIISTQTCGDIYASKHTDDFKKLMRDKGCLTGTATKKLLSE